MDSFITIRLIGIYGISPANFLTSPLLFDMLPLKGGVIYYGCDRFGLPDWRGDVCVAAVVGLAGIPVEWQSV